MGNKVVRSTSGGFAYTLEEVIGFIDVNPDEDFDRAVYEYVINSVKKYPEIKAIVENWDEGDYDTDSIRSMEKIKKIIEEETK